jgi:hypothetical protein
MRLPALLLVVPLLWITPLHTSAAEPGPHLAKIKAVGKEGTGNVEAARAWQELVKLGPAVVVDILSALDDADPTAANWLRSAVDVICDRELAASRPLPATKLEAFVKDTGHNGAARRLAYEWLVRVDASAPKRLLPDMLGDPGQEMRRDAVTAALAEAQKLVDKNDKEAATTALQKLFAAARDRDQVDLIAGKLKALGATVDMPTHFGIIQRWLIATPFDNAGGKGFAVAYPPEQKVDLNATYKGKDGAEVRWKEVTTTDPYGLVDINKQLGKHMGAAAYAFAVVESPEEQRVQIRATSNNAVKLFLNGKEIFFREEYHHGVRFDQHVGNGVLKPGRNEILIKVCQNEQKEDWAQSWTFQLRVCDAIGGAVPMKVLADKPKTDSGEGK